MFVDGNYHKIKKKLKKKDISIILDETEVSLFFSPQGYAATKGILPLIKQAKETIDVSIFFLTHNKISKALVDAKERGVKVRVILDATAATNGYSKHNYLRENGIDVKVESWGGKMHMKAAVIDSKHIIVGSMNWTLAGEKKNDENTIIIKNSSIHGNKLSSFFEEMWNSIPSSWLKNDPLPESIESGTSCYDSIDNDFDNIIDYNEKECFR
jgi:phosphatidylserine/phosphatidylglycerophosphate/cardiolipin synthase-like enzyme